METASFGCYASMNFRGVRGFCTYDIVPVSPSSEKSGRKRSLGPALAFRWSNQRNTRTRPSLSLSSSINGEFRKVVRFKSGKESQVKWTILNSDTKHRRPDSQHRICQLCLEVGHTAQSCPTSQRILSPRRKRSVSDSDLISHFRKNQHPSSSSKTQLRERVIEEILNTEAAYLSDLDFLVDTILGGIKNQKILTPMEISQVFFNVGAIRNFSAELLEAMRQELAKVPNGSICRPFLHKRGAFKLYFVYCSNQPVSLKTLEELKSKRTSLVEFLAFCTALPASDGLSIESYLIKPIQRVTKYPMLLRELLKYTQPTHPYYSDIAETLQAITQTVGQINTRERELHAATRMDEVADLMDGKGGRALLRGHGKRRLLYEGGINLKVKKRTRKKEKFSCHFFLLSDCFVWARIRKNRFKFLGALPLNEISCGTIGDIRNGIVLIHKGKEHVFFAKDPAALKSQIEKAITAFLNSETPRGTKIEDNRTDFIVENLPSDVERAPIVRCDVAPPLEDSCLGGKAATTVALIVVGPPELGKKLLSFPPEKFGGEIKMEELLAKVRREFQIEESVGIMLKIPHAENDWEMQPVTTQEQLDDVVHAKVWTVYFSLSLDLPKRSPRYYDPQSPPLPDRPSSVTEELFLIAKSRTEAPPLFQQQIND
eukprot:TRINITY_DN4609_c0_g1_i1.p1 TRINITY_DN4609_c0_g1~~TRINITY_DN4609_c0_g1_i1.p1  ORF type:complete len:693 (-),score=67.63 TRINITY_DN4609_c0_g1_i1:244-2211(-)